MLFVLMYLCLIYPIEAVKSEGVGRVPCDVPLSGAPLTVTTTPVVPIVSVVPVVPVASVLVVRIRRNGLKLPPE